MNEPEVAVYPDSGKVMARQQAPGHAGDRAADAVPPRRRGRLLGRRDRARGGSLIERVGVVGAGTMGAGIAQLACLGGFETYLHDPVADALGAGDRAAARGPAGQGRRAGPLERGEAEAAASALARRAEARGPRRLRAGDRGGARGPGAEARAVRAPGRVCGAEADPGHQHLVALGDRDRGRRRRGPSASCGMHFFNPPALMRLVEVVAGDRDLGGDARDAPPRSPGRMGREPIRAADEIGFVANRCARPFTLEALRLLGDRIADARADRPHRAASAAAFGWARSSSWTWSASTSTSRSRSRSGSRASTSRAGSRTRSRRRWSPRAASAARRAAATTTTGAGRTHRPGDPEPLRIASSGWSRDAAIEERGPLPGAARASMQATLVELAAQARDHARRTATAAEAYFRSLGKHVEWVGDAPGLVLGRIVCQLVNEAHFALGAGIAAAEDIDTAMRLGFNYPRGPFEWGTRSAPSAWSASSTRCTRSWARSATGRRPLRRRRGAASGIRSLDRQPGAARIRTSPAIVAAVIGSSSRTAP